MWNPETEIESGGGRGIHEGGYGIRPYRVTMYVGFFIVSIDLSHRRGRFHICPFPRPKPIPTISVYPKPISAQSKPVFALFWNVRSMANVGSGYKN
jgi:hypothetical protein